MRRTDGSSGERSDERLRRGPAGRFRWHADEGGGSVQSGGSARQGDDKLVFTIDLGDKSIAGEATLTDGDTMQLTTTSSGGECTETVDLTLVRVDTGPRVSPTP